MSKIIVGAICKARIRVCIIGENCKRKAGNMFIYEGVLISP